MMRWVFDSTSAAAEALEVVLKHARGSEDHFVFGGITVGQLVNAGLWVEGTVDGLAPKLDAVEGAARAESLGR